jgi:hypothetical protein
MTLARLLAAALFLCSLPVFTQDQQPIKQDELWRPGAGLSRCFPAGRYSFSGFEAAATPSEPWRIGPIRPADLGSGQNALDPKRLDQYRLDRVKGDPRIHHFKLDASDADTTCYNIRSYVVARDSKDSDSTHPAGYSTCLPSNRYQLRSAEVRVDSGDR